jgi:hypothetical protein
VRRCRLCGTPVRLAAGQARVTNRSHLRSRLTHPLPSGNEGNRLGFRGSPSVAGPYRPRALACARAEIVQNDLGTVWCDRGGRDDARFRPQDIRPAERHGRLGDRGRLGRGRHCSPSGCLSERRLLILSRNRSSLGRRRLHSGRLWQLGCLRRRRRCARCSGRFLCTGSGGGRLGASNIRSRGGPRRQQGERVDVTLWIARLAQAEVDVRLRMGRHARRPDSSDDRSLPHECPARDADGPEMQERCRVTERRLDREALPARRNRPCERDDTLGRCNDRRTGRRTEVDAAVLAAGVRMGPIERERSQHGTVDRPGPGLRDRYGQHEYTDDQESETPHDSSLLPGLRTSRP